MKDLASKLFQIDNDTPHAPRCGNLLVAEPFLNENYFTRSVLAVIDYSPQEGATGVVLNKPTEYRLSELLDEVCPENDIKVYCGGPLGLDRLFFIHNLGSDIIPNGRQFAPGLYIGGDFDAVIAYVNSGYSTEGNIRFFLGYSSWAINQLEEEIRQGTWAQINLKTPSNDLLSDENDSYWHRYVRALGNAYRPWQLLPANAIYN